MTQCIALVYDLRRDYLAEGYSQQDVAEFDSDSTIDALEEAITSLGYRVDRVGHARALAARLVAGDRWDLVFTIAEGLSGRSREAQVPALCELYGLPYTFSDPLTSALTLDKALTKRLLQAAGLPTPGFTVVERPQDIAAVTLTYPLFAKPVAEGTGKGVDARSRIDSAAQLEQVCTRLLTEYAQPVLVEEYLPGREFTTAVLGTGSDATVLGTLEIKMRPDAKTTDYSYEMKERCEELVEYLPMTRGPLRDRVERLALACHRTVQCRDAGRVDLRLDSRGQPSLIEINPLPGLHPTHSDLPMTATAEAMPYRDLIGAIIHSAMTRADKPPH